jgi:hypothetical protein
MAVAVHFGGPADGAEVTGVEQTQTRHWAPAFDRNSRGWISLARYVFVPPRRGARCRYRYTGVDQVKGPAPGTKEAPDWS